MSLSNWHNEVAQRFAHLHHGSVNELRKKKASISTPAGVEHWSYYDMEAWLIEHGEPVIVEPEQKLVSGRVSLRHSICCMRAKQAAGNLI